MQRQYKLLGLAVVTGMFCAVPGLYAENAGDEDASPSTYTVRWGDTLARIAHRTYGNGKLYPLIAQANGISNPHHIMAGATIVLPPSPDEVVSGMKEVPLQGVVPQVSSAAAETSAAQAPGGATHAAAVSTGTAAHTAVASGTITTPLSLPEAKPAFVWRQETNGNFSPGEKLTFAIRWKFLTVGSATMAIDGVDEVQGRKAYHIVTSARSAPFFDTFYKVRDVNESWMDTEALCSLKFCSRIDENNYKKTETIILDHEKGQFQAVEDKKSGPIPLWVQDVLSSLYYLRTKDLEVGKSIMVDAHSGDKSWPLKVNVLRKEKVKVPAGEFECFVVEPVIREGAGIFQAKGKLWVWMTADNKKIPVLMRSKIAVGSIEAMLTEKKLP